MFATIAAQIGKSVLESRRGQFGRFRPGQPLSAASDEFVREVISPAVQSYVSPAEDWIITIFHYVNILFLATATEFFLWIGIADLMTYYIWPDPSYTNTDGVAEIFNATAGNFTEFALGNISEILWNTTGTDTSEEEDVGIVLTASSFVYYCCGFICYFISVRFCSMDVSYEHMDAAWREGLPKSFGWKRKILGFFRALLNFFAYVLIITGAWTVYDTEIWTDTILRDILYLVTGILLSFIFGELLSPESVLWIAGHRGQKIQRKNKQQDTDYPVIVYPHCCCENPAFRPGQKLPWVQDSFVRDVIHPALKQYISPGEAFIIDIFNYFNAVFILPTTEAVQWIGIWDLLVNWLTWDDLQAQQGTYLGIGFFLLILSHVFFNTEKGWVDLEDSWKNGLSKSFGWRRKCKNFGRGTFSFLGFVFVWVGASLVWDYDESSALTYGLYVLFGAIVMLLSGEILAIDSMYYLDAFWTKKWREVRGESDAEGTYQAL